MKERLLDVIKWGLILVIAGAVFYVVYPKYTFKGRQGGVWFRCNKMTGEVERWYHKGTKLVTGTWFPFPFDEESIKWDKPPNKVGREDKRQEAKTELEKPKDIFDKIDFEKELKGERLKKAKEFLEGRERQTKGLIIDFSKLPDQRKYKSLSEIEKAYRKELLQKEEKKKREKQREQKLSQILEMMDRVDAEFEAKKK